MGVIAFLGLEGLGYQSSGGKGKRRERGKTEMHCATQNYRELEVSPVESHLAQEQILEQI